MTINSCRYKNIVETTVHSPYLLPTPCDNTLTSVFKNTVKAIATVAILPVAALTGIVCHSKKYVGLYDSSDEKAPQLRELQQWLVIDEIKQAALQIQSAFVTVALGAKDTASNESVFSRLCDEGKPDLAALLLENRSSKLTTHECRALSQAIILHQNNDLLSNLLQEHKVDVSFEEIFLQELCGFAAASRHDALYDTLFTYGELYYTDKYPKWILSLRPAIAFVGSRLALRHDPVAKKSPLTVAIDKNDKSLLQEVLKKKYTKDSDACWKVNGRAELYEFEMDKMADFIVKTGATDILAELLVTPFEDPYMSFHQKLLIRLLQSDNQDIKDRCITVLISDSTFFRDTAFRNAVSENFEERLGATAYKKLIEFLHNNYESWGLSRRAFPKSIIASFTAIDKALPN